MTMDNQQNTPSGRILIADDDPVVRHILGAILTSKNFEIDAASSGTECLEALQKHKAQGTSPLLVFLDMFLGDMHGTDVLKELRTLFGATVPVIMLSANPKDETLAVNTGSDPDDYLEKPFTGPIVLERLERLLSR